MGGVASISIRWLCKTHIQSLYHPHPCTQAKITYYPDSCIFSYEKHCLRLKINTSDLKRKMHIEGFNSASSHNCKIWKGSAVETVPHFVAVFTFYTTAICQKHELKTYGLIKMLKTVPVQSPRSVDIKAHIIESCWPLPSQGRSTRQFSLATVKLIRSVSHTEPWGTSDPFCLPPSLTAYVFPC